MSTPFFQFFVPKIEVKMKTFITLSLPGISFSLATVLLTWSRLRELQVRVFLKGKIFTWRFEKKQGAFWYSVRLLSRKICKLLYSSSSKTSPETRSNGLKTFRSPLCSVYKQRNLFPRVSAGKKPFFLSIIWLRTFLIGMGVFLKKGSCHAAKSFKTHMYGYIKNICPAAERAQDTRHGDPFVVDTHTLRIYRQAGAFSSRSQCSCFQRPKKCAAHSLGQQHPLVCYFSSILPFPLISRARSKNTHMLHNNS